MKPNRAAERREAQFREKQRQKQQQKRSPKKRKAPAVDDPLKKFLLEQISRQLRDRRPEVFIPFPMVDGERGARDDDQALLRRAEKAEAEVSNLKRFAQEISEQASLVGTVLRVDGRTCIVQAEGALLRCTCPEGASPGAQVLINSKTRQPHSVLANPVRSGVALTVQAVTPSGFEVAAAEGVRVVLRGPVDAQVGDRIITDPSGSVAVANIGRPRSAQTFTANPNVDWDDIGGLEEAKAALREAVELPVRYPEVYSRYGKKPARGVLLYGPPGCGKTMLAKACATALHRLHGTTAAGGFISLKGPEVLSKWVGETEAAIRGIFAQAREYQRKHGRPAVIFIDEADSLLADRTRERGVMGRTVVPTFLAEMDGLDDSGAFVILATNLPNSLDPAITRDRRIDRRIHVGRPGKEQTAAIFERWLGSRPLAAEACLPALASGAASEVFDPTLSLMAAEIAGTDVKVELLLSDVVSGALIEGIVERATELAIRRELDGGTTGLSLQDLQRATAMAARELAATNLTSELVTKARAIRPQAAQVQTSAAEVN